MKIPEECKAILSDKKIALSGKRTTTLYLLNPKERRVEKIVVDGCAITEGKRCDWLVRLNDPISKEEVFVELKGSSVYEAVDQLRTTIKRLSTDRAKLPKRSFIVFNRNPMTGTDTQKYALEFRKKFNSELKLVKDKQAVPL
jgi:hypothetical protein